MNIPITLITVVFVLSMSCDRPTENTSGQVSADNTSVHTDTLHGSTASGMPHEGISDPEYNARMLLPKVEILGEYEIKMTYLKYNEDVYHNANPGIMEVYKRDRLLFTDSIKGYDEMYVHSLEYHNLSGKKFVFTLHYGTEACDYMQGERYYCIDTQDKVSFLKEYWSSFNSYAAAYNQTIFPEDSSGIQDCLQIVEGIHYQEHDEPDLYDTTRIQFANNTFTIIKLTNNLDRE